MKSESCLIEWNIWLRIVSSYREHCSVLPPCQCSSCSTRKDSTPPEKWVTSASYWQDIREPAQIQPVLLVGPLPPPHTWIRKIETFWWFGRTANRKIWGVLKGWRFLPSGRVQVEVDVVQTLPQLFHLIFNISEKIIFNVSEKINLNEKSQNTCFFWGSITIPWKLTGSPNLKGKLHSHIAIGEL